MCQQWKATGLVLAITLGIASVAGNAWAIDHGHSDPNNRYEHFLQSQHSDIDDCAADPSCAGDDHKSTNPSYGKLNSLNVDSQVPSGHKKP